MNCFARSWPEPYREELTQIASRGPDRAGFNLRLYLPVYVIPREAQTDVEVGGYRIPEGAGVMLPIRTVQRDERLFEDSETFRSARREGYLRTGLHDFAHAPFGGGPRICIGRTFAILEAKLALATIGRRFDLRWRGDNEADGEPPTAPR